MLVAAMMVLSLVAIPVLADGEVVFAVENAPATATPGDEITVNLTVNGTFEAHVLNMQFNYNADAFELCRMRDDAKLLHFRLFQMP